MPADSIASLPQLSSEALDLNDVLAVVSLGAADTKKITAEDFLLGIVNDLPDDTIDGSKVLLDLTGYVLTTDNYGDNTITAEKLGDDSTWDLEPSNPAAGKFVGQALLNTTTGYAYVWNGGAWVGYKAVDSINSIVTVNNPRNIQLDTSQTDDQVTITANYGDTAIAAGFLAGPTAGGGDITQRQIASGDLPNATLTEPGAVVPGSGLTVDGNGTISIDNTVTASVARSLVTYDEKGLITGGSSPIQPSDLPTATKGTPGVVTPGAHLNVSSGELIVDNTVTPGPGTYAKVAVNEVGLVTEGLSLLQSDLPTLSYDNITSGTVKDGSLDDQVVGTKQFKDYATVLMQEDNPGAGDYLGQLWWTPSTAQLRVYDRGSGPGNIWRPVGFGALAADNLRWGGTFDASNSTIVNLTDTGRSDTGLKLGDKFPAPEDVYSGLYFICVVAGNKMDQANLTGKSINPGDWALCLSKDEGWTQVEVGSGGGGGAGSVRYLDDLLDVSIGGAADPFEVRVGEPRVTLEGDQVLRYDGATGVWRNTSLLDGGSID